MWTGCGHPRTFPLFEPTRLAVPVRHVPVVIGLVARGNCNMEVIFVPAVDFC